MLFSSLVFLFVFFPIVLGLYYLSADKYRNYILLIASLFFYAWGEPVYVLLMIGSIIVNYIFGFLVCPERTERTRKLFLVVSIIFNIALLIVFKYSMFIVESINTVVGSDFTVPQIVLPLGISFYTFQALSYVVDVYRGDARIQKSVFDLGLYISLFPQLVAGPIVRYDVVENQIHDREHSLDKFAQGVRRFICGLGKKIIIANQMGLVADYIFAKQTDELSVVLSWMGIIAYSLQIFFDFSGYSDMAIGLGKMFGFEFTENFDYPYISQSITEFWRRWHISLGSWFRDYIYIPMGGNRVGKVKYIRNILVVWILTGVWHGASWTFVAWGLYYGIILLIEKKIMQKILNKVWRPIRHIYVILVVLIGWVFFRADDFSYSFEFIKGMYGFNNIPLVNNDVWIYIRDYWYIFILGIVFSTPICKKIAVKLNNSKREVANNIFVCMAEGCIYAGILLIVIMHLVNSNYNPFIYFRF